jgi:drug/metabolite transporter (DMT)-like permease
VGSTSTASCNGQFGALATVALWCASFALIKHLVDSGLAAQDVALGRFVVAWPGFLFLLWRAGGLPGLRRSEALRIFVASAAGVTAYHLALNAGEHTTASGVAALIVALGPAATLALALAVGLESYAPRRLAGIALAFAGVVVVVVLGSGAHFSLHGLRGPLLVLAAPLTFAVYNILYKPLLGRYDLPALTAAGGLAGSLMFLPFENTGAVDRFGALAAGSWLALAALGLGATLGGYVTWSIALRSLEPSRAMSYLYLVPPLAVAIGALALDEPVTGWLLLGGALVIGGVAVAQRQPARTGVILHNPCVEAGERRPCRS